jgi:hypothetical protein
VHTAGSEVSWVNSVNSERAAAGAFFPSSIFFYTLCFLLATLFVVGAGVCDN